MASETDTTTETTARDYRETVFLPETDFPMRGGLPKAEPEMLKKWAEADLYNEVRKARQAKNAPLFVMHDGPPYANGNIHIGHALNKLLKDFVVRSKFLMGYDVDYVPGWDCHGLPIEWKIEEEFRAKGRKKGDVPAAEFRKACREYAAKWIDIQREEFKRLGGLGDWDNRYATMDFDTEAKVTEEFHKFMMSGQLYRGSKPVMWSPVERTALADAEVEYADHVSPTVWVKFPVRGAIFSDGIFWESTVEASRNKNRNFTEFHDSIKDASVVIWTTTPWTIPANRAVSFNPKVAYGLYKITEVASEETLGFKPWVSTGDQLVLAEKLAEDVLKAANATSFIKLETLDASFISSIILSHPLAELDDGYGFNVPMLAGDHVTDDAGTGFVHTAPGHGADDYQVWLGNTQNLSSKNIDITIPNTVDPDGAYYSHVPLFAGLKVLETEGKKAGKFGDANKIVMEKLIETGNLLARGRVEHSYPHSWRSKAPVIFRNTPQWFIKMDRRGDVSIGSKNFEAGSIRSYNPNVLPNDQDVKGQTLRQTALTAIDQIAFYPAQGKNRIRSMVETRPDWLISRQRNWGTPLAMYVDKKTGEPLRDEAVNKRIIDRIRDGGADAWFTLPDAEFLGNGYNPDDYEKITDILDVWFDSGSTHAFTLEGRENTRSPADLYLEGSDQHRGWFQSSLLESCGTRGHAPFKGVLTHGFVLDEQGEKMSKSKGNVVSPQDVAKESGVEILRLWVALSDYSEDLRIGKQILQTTIDAYRKLRNSIRYLLGALNGYSEAEQVAYKDMPSLERYILHRVHALDAQVRDAYGAYDFAGVIRPVADFASQTLSALYFDIRKDCLYCDRPDSVKRRATRTVLNILFERLTAWLGPIMSFTTEEAWSYRYPDAAENVFRTLNPVPAEWHNEAEATRWEKIEHVLDVVTGALEEKRREKVIGAALEAAPHVYIDNDVLMAAFDGIDASEVFRTSQAVLSNSMGPEHAFRLEDVKDVSVVVLLAHGQKCQRSWRILPEVGTDPRYPDLSHRDADAVAYWDKVHG
ncbi:isoleucine--tRNA ligase [Asticcacaulis sp. SL142]|uniref:isoleucine--tRNA ligase n=1 Tax=Asticcacaulis sp. SL142 TaxID=2995155 RepID=UPI00226C83EA|nr:isoleucine--tRNA ligase [Asticcacaulis sp. SL142]WAC48527.1 isoleucine--tRNA ligase [Asticcacaulis sp. SL142]